MLIKAFSNLQNEKTYLFEKEKVSKSVFILAFPTIISQLIGVIYNVADTWFISQTGDENQVAAATVAFPLFLTLTAISNLFGIGGSSYIARALGKKEFIKAKQGSAFAFWGATLLALAFSLGVLVFKEPLLYLLGAQSNTYTHAYHYVLYSIVFGALPSILNPVLAHLVRSQGYSLQASIGMSIGGLLNILLDPFFIFPWGLGLEITGAALATAIANYVATGYFLGCLILKRKEFHISLHPKYLKAPKKVGKTILSIGFPSSIQMFMSVLSNGVLNKLMSGYSAAALSAVGIAKKIDSLPTAITQGISNGILPLLGYNHSSGNKKRMKKAFHFASLCAIGFSLVFFMIIAFFAPEVIGLFMNDPQVILYGSGFLKLHAFSTPFMAVGFMVIALYQGAGNARPALILSLFRKGLIDIPLMIIFNQFWPMYGLMAVQPLMDILNTVIAIYLYFRFWKKEKAI